MKKKKSPNQAVKRLLGVHPNTLGDSITLLSGNISIILAVCFVYFLTEATGGRFTADTYSCWRWQQCSPTVTGRIDRVPKQTWKEGQRCVWQTCSGTHTRVWRCLASLPLVFERAPVSRIFAPKYTTLRCHRFFSSLLFLTNFPQGRSAARRNCHCRHWEGDN